MNKDITRQGEAVGGKGSWASPAHPFGHSGCIVAAHPALPPSRARGPARSRPQAPLPRYTFWNPPRGWALNPKRPLPWSSSPQDLVREVPPLVGSPIAPHRSLPGSLSPFIPLSPSLHHSGSSVWPFLRPQACAPNPHLTA